MGQALYRKHRPKKLSEVIGQDHITSTLSSALKNGRISHAYLFTGPRGVGKTSIARILAHEVNGLDYNEEQNHLDIIEIDAASNRRIDEIRELREKVHNAPTSAKYKVYIIDEVHMLTREAFNALLKTLEEPPEHVIFILATTEAHKLPDTIISRTQHFSFKPIDDGAAVDYLSSLAKTENIDITDEALELIAAHGNGSFRDSISLLDQVRNSSSKLDADGVRRMLGIAPEQAISNLIAAQQLGDISKVIELLAGLFEQGSSAKQLAKQINNQLRQEIIKSSSLDVAKLIRELIEVPASHDPQAALQIALIEATLNNDSTERLLPATKVLKIDNVKPPEEIITTTDSPVNEILEEEQPTETTLEVLEPTELWPKVLAEIKKHHNTLYSIARMARTTTESDSLKLEFEFAFHQKRLNESKNKQIILDIIQRLTGKNYQVECLLIEVDKKAKPPKVPPAPNKQSLATISNIFGDAEVLES